MHAKYLIFNQGSYWDEIKTLYKFFPKLDRKSPFAFFIETVDSAYGCTFMISSQEKNLIWKQNSHAKQ